MKNILLILTVFIAAGLHSCTEEAPKDGGDQVSPPVMNSGTATETQRAIEAGKDSADSHQSSDSIEKETPKK